jgi:hypothetical protein
MWRLEENPAWVGQQPSGLTESACHDHSHVLTIVCSCGEEMHFHETDAARVPSKAGIATKCKGCGELLRFEPGYLQHAFAEMRKQGWIR